MPRWPATTSPTSPSRACSTRSPAADGRPVPPLNLLGDFGGGGMVLALGVVAALWHARASGQGQVVDAAIVDGVAAMTAMHQSMLRSGLWPGSRGANLFDGGAPFYRCYRTADDRWLAVGAIEPVFYERLLRGLGPGRPGRRRRPARPRAVAAGRRACSRERIAAAPPRGAGWRSSPTSTPAWPRCSPCRRRAATPTSPRGARMPPCPAPRAASSRRRRPGSRPLPPLQAHPPQNPELIPTQ